MTISLTVNLILISLSMLAYSLSPIKDPLLTENTLIFTVFASFIISTLVRVTRIKILEKYYSLSIFPLFNANFFTFISFFVDLFHCTIFKSDLYYKEVGSVKSSLIFTCPFIFSCMECAQFNYMNSKVQIFSAVFFMWILYTVTLLRFLFKGVLSYVFFDECAVVFLLTAPYFAICIFCNLTYLFYFVLNKIIRANHKY